MTEQDYKRYKELQREVAEAGLDPLPEYELLRDWQAKQDGAFQHPAYCTRMMAQGKLPGVVRLGRDYIIPKRARGVGKRSLLPREKTKDGIRL